MKKLSYFFGLMAIILSDIMCAVVAYNYCNYQWSIEYRGFSAPASVAYYSAIPYGIAIGVCIVLAVTFQKKTLRK